MNCSKCGGLFGPPQYHVYNAWMGLPWSDTPHLTYVCGTCKYEYNTLCKDAKPETVARASKYAGKDVSFKEPEPPYLCGGAMDVMIPEETADKKVEGPTFEEMQAVIADFNEEALYADTYEKALVGYIRIFNKVLPLYDQQACLNILMEGFDEDEDGDPHTQAVEWFEFNTVGAYMGENTPAFGVFFKPVEVSEIDGF